MIIKTFREAPLDNNNYVIIDEVSHEATLIDCSAPDDAIMDYIHEQKATLKFILLTHGHLDHVMGLIHFQQKYGTKAYLYRDDAPLLAHINDWTKFLGWPPVEVPTADVLIDEKTSLKLGDTSIQIIHTPGHTWGGVCYLIENNLFSGDTLFRGTHGRTDLDGGDSAKIYASLAHLFTLPDDTIVYPGHGAPTTIGAEKNQLG